jgi:hypothetical protein
MLLVAVDALLGMLLLVTIAVFTARRPRVAEGTRAAGWFFVLPLPLAVVLHLVVELPVAVDQTLFVAGVAGFAIGAALLLGRDDEDWREPDDGEPPWWPGFEREFRDYARKPRPTARV